MANLIKLPHDAFGPEENLQGYDVYDSAGEKLGDIDEVIADEDSMQPRYLVVDAGNWFSSKKFVVPIGDVQRVDDDERHVYFKTLTKRTLESGTYPRYDDAWWDQNAHQQWSTHETELARAYGKPGERVDYNSDLYRRPEQGARRLQLMEERLKVNKQREQAGTVRLGKRITEHTETVNVPVREERVVIERRPGGGQPATGRELGEGEAVEVPVTRERVEVTKEPVVAEEVNVRKETTERTHQAQETVRKEELDVDDKSGLTSPRGATEETRATPTERRDPGTRTP